MSDEFYNPDLSIIDNIPITRQERINAVWAIILKGEKTQKGYNLQNLISKIAVRWGIKRRTVKEYFQDLENAGFTRIDDRLKVRPIMKKAKGVSS